MRATSQFFDQQISLCARRAADSALANQRDMFLRAGAAWQALADREMATQAEREKRNPPRAPA
jgi:hypothetical protein